MRCFSAVLLASASIACAGPLQWEPAPPADEFVDHIGVCSHLGYRNSQYFQSYNRVKELLKAAGIRYMRDGWDPHMTDLHASIGIKFVLLSEPQWKPLDQQLKFFETNRDLFAMIEGPNEPNNFWPKHNVVYQSQMYPKACILWQNDLFHAVRSDTALNGLLVTSPTPIFDGAQALAPLNSFDLLATHPYSGGQMPSAPIEWNGRTMRQTIDLVGVDHDLKPLIATECGYHYALGGEKTLGAAMGGISEKAGGKYLLRHFAEFFNAGFVKTITYEFVDRGTNPNDPEDNFGMLHHDLTPKPAYTAVANLNALLGESHWDAASGQWTAPECAPHAVEIAVDAPPTVHHTTLSRSDGTIDLLIWNEVPSFDVGAKKDLSPNSVKATVAIPSPATARLYRPLTGTDAIHDYPAATSFDLDVPDEVLLLRIAGHAPSGVAPSVPTQFTATTTATSATLHWAAGGDMPAAYIVRRNGQYLATVTPAADGAGGFKDDALTAGFGFPYTVQAVSKDGLLSEPATVTARTPNERPNLVIESLSTDPPHPQPGDEVTFIATLANIGIAPTPVVPHGVAFQIDGKVVCWSDTFHGPLQPGQRQVVRSNNGPSGKGMWLCTPGTFHLNAAADDVNRINESNESDNGRRITFSTGVGSDLMVDNIQAVNAPVANKPLKLSAVVHNVGTAPTPAGVKTSCTFYWMDASGKRTTLGFGVSSQSLAPGEQTVIPMANTWLPPAAGTYSIAAVADDIDRIAETNEKNNTAPAIDLVVK